MLKQPKPFLDKIKHRNISYGVERRRNLSKLILENGTPFPKSVGYKDIDKSVQDWVENSLSLSHDGIKIPTFKLFSNQRINEYAQEWFHTDNTGNLIMNFKTITRENNPKKGENQGDNYNIPGNRDYPMFIVPVLQENGSEAYDMYSMKQPFCVDLEYTISLVTNQYDLINKMNELVNFEFKSIDCYISPNNHFMPMVLEDISDESEYNIDDRKYFSQSYKIKVKAYIIRDSDFKVTKLPSRAVMRILGVDDKVKPKISVEEVDYFADDCCLREEYDPYYNKLITLTINFPKCARIADFKIDTDMVIRSIETENVYDFVMSVNDEFMSFDRDLRIYDSDDLHFEIERDDLETDSKLIIKGFDPNTVIDERYNPESSIDDVITHEEIEYNAKEGVKK